MNLFALVMYYLPVVEVVPDVVPLQAERMPVDARADVTLEELSPDPALDDVPRLNVKLVVLAGVGDRGHRGGGAGRQSR